LVRILSSPFVAIPRIIHGHEKIHSGKLRAIGYDAARRLLRVELEGGAALEYSGVSADLWRRFTASGVAWSFYRDNIEDEFPAKAGARVAGLRVRSGRRWMPCLVAVRHLHRTALRTMATRLHRHRMMQRRAE
jgi:hypothetical protein